jgi:hypothetical protein
MLAIYLFLVLSLLALGGAIALGVWADSNYKDWLVFVSIVTGVLSFLAAFVLAVFGVSAPIDRAACHRFADSIGREANWELIGGCYIEVDGRFVPRGWIVPVVEGEKLRIEIETPLE